MYKEHIHLTRKHLNLTSKHTRLTRKHLHLTHKHIHLPQKHIRLTSKHKHLATLFLTKIQNSIRINIKNNHAKPQKHPKSPEKHPKTQPVSYLIRKKPPKHPPILKDKATKHHFHSK